MKHPQYIFAFNKKAFGPVDPGITPMNIQMLKQFAERSLMLGRRHELESNEDFGQALPYIVLVNGNGLFTYRRTKLVGESRLAGNLSVGIGGHIDAGDAQFTAPNVIDPLQTFAAAIGRELDEELIFTSPDGKESKLSGIDKEALMTMAPSMAGLINDTSNEVGRVHYGIFMVLRVPDGYNVRCAEEELETIGFTDPTKVTGEFESWSNLVTKFMNQGAPSDRPREM